MATALKDKLVTLEDLQQAYSKLKGELDEMGEVTTATGTFKTITDVTWESDNVISLTKSGNVVSLIINLSALSPSTAGHYVTTQNDVIATIPSGFRPAEDLHAEFNVFTGTTSPYAFVVGKNGNIFGISGIGNSTKCSRYGHIMYIAAN